MLIQALCDYYDLLAAKDKILPAGYSKQNVQYRVELTPDGKIDAIFNVQQPKEIVIRGKIKTKLAPLTILVPQRTEKPGIDANIIEHRPLYLFGLNYEDGRLTPEDQTGKARKSHAAFVKKNLEFLEGLNDPSISAYRAFLQNWKPEKEQENPHLLQLEKNYGKSSYAFCLRGEPDRLLSENPLVKARWEERQAAETEQAKNGVVAQCAVSGVQSPIAGIHRKIKGISGGLPTGTVLIGFNNASESSYGNEQSYNSNISETCMKKYTEALNSLLSSSQHKMLVDDVTIVFWAMSTEETPEKRFMAMLNGQADGMDSEQTEEMLRGLMRDIKNGKLSEERLQSLGIINPDVDFYMVGLKPNSSRVSVKWIYRKRFAEMLWNLARYQHDLQIGDRIKPIPFDRIKQELRSPHSTKETFPTELMTKLFQAAIYGGTFPMSFLETALRRVRTDTDLPVNPVRVGIIKASINRRAKEEVMGIKLDKENKNQAYLCGRLFAVLERIQQQAAGTELNRTIKDTYFAAASSTPASVFPKLIRLSNYHMKNARIKNWKNYYEQQIGEITGNLNDEFPQRLSLIEQGKFDIGYFHQYQSYFEKKENQKAQPKGENRVAEVREDE